MSRIAYSLLLTSASCLSACGCGGTGRSDAGADGGDADARAADADVSDVREVEMDMASADAGSSPWYRPEGLPEACEVRATHDASAMRSVSYESCADREGCRALITADLVHRGETLTVGWTDSYVATTPAWFAVSLRGPASQTEIVVVSDQGRAGLSLRVPVTASRCRLSTLAIAGERVAVLVADQSGVESIPNVVSCPLPPEAGRCRVIDRWGADELHGNFSQNLFAATTHIAVHTVPAQTVWRVEWDGGGHTLIAGWDVQRVLGEPSAVAADATFYTLFDLPRNTIGVSVGGTPTLPAGRSLISDPEFDAMLPMADGRDLVWYQGYGRRDVNDFERIELWASPFATTREAVAPRRLAATPRRSASLDARLGYGRVAHREGDVIAVYELSDGARHEIRAPEGEVWSGGILYLGPEEIAVASGLPDSRAQRSVMLIRYNALGGAVLGIDGGMP